MKKLIFLLVIFSSLFMVSCEKDPIDPIDPIVDVIKVTFNATVTNVTEYGKNDGTITVNVLSGTLPYEFTLNSNVKNTDGKFTSLKAGNYNITVTDSKSQTFSDNVIITQPDSVIIPTKNLIINIEVVDVKCFGGNDGKITVKASGGTSPYTFNLNGGTYQNDSVFNVNAGTYNVTVKDSKNVTVNKSVTIVQPSVLTISANIVNIKCFGESNGSIALSASGGTSPYTFTLDGNTTFTNLAPKTYTASVVDVNGCTTSDNYKITSPTSALSATVNVVNVSIFGATDGKITVKASGGTKSYIFTLNGVSNSTGVFNVGAGTYDVDVVDANGCNINVSGITVTQPDEIKVGDIKDGGIVLYVDNGHGLIVYPTDNIPNNWPVSNEICNALGNGWRLPTKTELEKMIENSKLLNMIIGRAYWSVTPHEHTGGDYYTGRFSIYLNRVCLEPSSASLITNSRAVKSF